ncbi:GNAT family N-acetyltransferase [Gordonia desulfuricans]|uniref:GNAT family N-acetyltransferase n=1 Tax=Gordonia desulfuricans TaxID=89051 RepID=A0A7K3LLA5_9ACTN|nr:GNAT family N-acetyltransferase [Gordonia desulfuricans]NDK89026.1 GNAT family N-acetyltransferase [Gordonia desulfuricans]
MSWTAERIVEESVAWKSSWHPDGSEHIVDGPCEFYLADGVATLLQYHADSSVDPVAALDEAAATTRAHGADILRFTAGVGVFGGLTDTELARRAAHTVAVVDVIAGEPTETFVASIPLPADVTVHRVATDADVAEFARISRQAWGFEPHALRDPGFRVDDERIRLFVARIDGEPVGAGGYEHVRAVARMWGAAIVTEARSRGAYRSLVAARLDDARTLGAGLAIIHAEQTSSPILQRLGFGRFAERRLTSIPLTAG